jgi:Flp pilus assembly protein TadD
MKPLRAIVPAVLAAALAAGCSKPAPGARAAAPAQEFARSQALIDSGNVAFRAGDFENAARRYASASVARPDDPAAWFGLGMALAKLGRDDDARVAYAKARALSGGAAPDTAFRHQGN